MQIYLLLLLSVSTSADTLMLPVANICSQPLRLPVIAHKTDTIDLQQLFANSSDLAQVLQNNSANFIKYYGLNGIATLGMRGLGSTQTQVMWNGMSLQHAGVGTIDLSLIPMSMFDKVTIQYGSDPVNNGSGSAGGCITLTSLPSKSTAHVQYQFSSLLNHDFSARTTNQIKSWKYNIGVGVNHRKNRFDFINNTLIESPLQKMPVNLYKAILGFAEIEKLIRKKIKLSTGFWIQNNSRNLPPLMSSLTNNAFQIDNTQRLYLNLTYFSQKLNCDLFSNTQFYALDYIDSSLGIYSLSNTHMSNIITHVKYQFSEKIKAGFESSFIDERVTVSDAYPLPKIRTRLPASIFIEFDNKNLQLQIGSKTEIVNGKLLPILPSVNLLVEASRILALKLATSKHYRLPTINDLYWPVGGNSNLKPEQGFNCQGAITITTDPVTFGANTAVQLISEVGFYYSRITDLIQWQPGNTAFWQAQNLDKIHSNGIEASLKAIGHFKKIKFNQSIHYNLINAYQTLALNTKQLIYTPKHRIQISSTISYLTNHLELNYGYTDRSFTIADNSRWLTPFTTLNLTLAKSFQMHQTDIKIGITAENLLNSSYMVLPNRAMPLRYFKFNININL
ncbi:MAG: hypothetical protein RIQ89_2152 [Bacteroidota bacterium]